MEKKQIKGGYHTLLSQDTGSDMYEKIDDGILLCKMINLAAPDTIDERVINTGNTISIFKVVCTSQLSF